MPRVIGNIQPSPRTGALNNIRLRRIFYRWKVLPQVFEVIIVDGITGIIEDIFVEVAAFDMEEHQEALADDDLRFELVLAAFAAVFLEGRIAPVAGGALMAPIAFPVDLRFEP